MWFARDDVCYSLSKKRSRIENASIRIEKDENEKLANNGLIPKYATGYHTLFEIHLYTTLRRHCF